MSFTYFISSDTIGYEDPELGKRLMHNFFMKLLEVAEKLSHIFFGKEEYNSYFRNFLQ